MSEITQADREALCADVMLSIPAYLHRSIHKAFARHRSQTRKEALEEGRAVRDAAIDLALKAGTLNVALDGLEQYRHKREGVLNAMKRLTGALTAPLSASEGGEGVRANGEAEDALGGVVVGSHNREEADG